MAVLPAELIARIGWLVLKLGHRLSAYPPRRRLKLTVHLVRKLLRDVAREIRRKAFRGEELDDDRLPRGSHISVLAGRPAGYLNCTWTPL
jgi:hypothetical protein